MVISRVLPYTDIIPVGERQLDVRHRFAIRWDLEYDCISSCLIATPRWASPDTMDDNDLDIRIERAIKSLRS